METILSNLKMAALNARQEAALAADAQADMILLAPTGSGKTVAYLLPLVKRLKADVVGVQAVILVPSRELALQTEQVFKQMGTPFRVMSCYGGRPTMEEHRTMRGVMPHVIVATPGRMNDHLAKENFEAATVTTLVIDEFDKCLEFGFHDEMASVLAQLPSVTKRVLLSATDAAELPAFTGLGKTVRLNFLTAEERDRIHLFRVASPQRDKLETLHSLLCCLGSQPTIVFVNHRESAERIGAYLQTMGIFHETFHGGMEQERRERALYKFRNGSCSVFVSTDLAARGLDIPEIENIVHYHLPTNQEGYVHRNGRTARWEAEGRAFLVLHSEESVPDYVGNVPEFTLPTRLPKPQPPQWATVYIGKGKKDKISKMDIVGFLCKKGGITAQELGRVDVHDHYAMAAVRRSRVKQLLQQVRGEKIKGVKTIFEEMR